MNDSVIQQEEPALDQESADYLARYIRPDQHPADLTVVKILMPEFRPLTDAEKMVLGRFIRSLPSTPELSWFACFYFHNFVFPHFDPHQAETIVKPSQILDTLNQHYRHDKPFTLSEVCAMLDVTFGKNRLLVFGQLEVERDLRDCSLIVRVNQPNLWRLVELLANLEVVALI